MSLKAIRHNARDVGKHSFNLLLQSQVSYEPRYEKTGFLHICENKDADQLRGQRLCFRYTDSTSPLLPKFEILSL